MCMMREEQNTMTPGLPTSSKVKNMPKMSTLTLTILPANAEEDGVPQKAGAAVVESPLLRLPEVLTTTRTIMAWKVTFDRLKVPGARSVSDPSHHNSLLPPLFQHRTAMPAHSKSKSATFQSRRHLGQESRTSQSPGDPRVRFIIGGQMCRGDGNDEAQSILLKDQRRSQFGNLVDLSDTT